MGVSKRRIITVTGGDEAKKPAERISDALREEIPNGFAKGAAHPLPNSLQPTNAQKPSSDIKPSRLDQSQPT